MAYKYVHIIHNDKFILPFIEYIDNYFNGDEHLYVYLYDDNAIKYPIPNRDNVLNICNQYPGRRNIIGLSRVLTPVLKDAEKIILHGLFAPELVNYLFFHQYLLKKTYWIAWGGDFYNPEKQSWMKKKVFENMGFILTYIKEDFRLIQKWYGAKGELLEFISYPSNLCPKLGLQSKIKDGYIHILVGNSANPTNNHEEVFSMLKDYDNIKLYLPLSYGKIEYAERISEIGENMFGKRFVALKEFIPYKDYVNLLSQIDIAIFAFKRQQAMGNIISLIGMGKKVYIRNDISMWNFFQELGIKVFDYENVNIEPLDSSSQENNSKIIKEVFSEVNYIKQLKTLFE